MGADKKVREDAARTGIALFPSAHGVALKCSAGSSPDGRQSSSTSYFSNPALDRFFAGSDTLISDLSIFCKSAYGCHPAHPYAVLVALKQQAIAGLKRRAHGESPEVE